MSDEWPGPEFDEPTDPRDWIKPPPGVDEARRKQQRKTNGKADTAHESGRLRLLTVDDLLKLPTRNYLVKGWLSPNEISLLVGAKNTRKTFTALHVGYGVAQGWPTVFGRRITQTPVLYIITEGENGVGKRVDALVRRYGRCDAFLVIAQPIDLLHSTADAGDLHDLIAIARANGTGLIVVDTVSRVMPGGEENASGDMGTLLHNLNVLRYATGAHVMGIHHGTQQDGTKSRGHSTLPNGADAIAQSEWTGEADGTGTLTLGFARDDVCGAIGAFRTSVVRLGADQDGDEITTLLVEECQSNDRKPPRNLPPTRRKFYEALLAAIGKAGGGGRTTLQAWEDEVLRRGLIDPAPEHETGAQRRGRLSDFRRAKSDLISKDWIAMDGDWVIDLARW